MHITSSWNRLRRALTPTRKSARRPSSPRPLRLDVLEDRSVPATLSLNAGVLTYDAGAGVANKLTVNYDAVTQKYGFADGGETIALVGLAGAGSGTNAVTLDPVAHLSVLIRLGDRGDTAQILGSRFNKPMVVYGETGDDWVDVGDGATTLSNIQGEVIVRGFDGHDELHLHDYAVALPGQFYQVSDQSVRRGGIAPVSFDAQVEHVRLNAGTGNDLVRVWSTAATATTSVNMKAGGADTVVVGSAAGSLDDIHGYLLVAGDIGPGGPLDILVVNDAGDIDANAYRLTANAGPGSTYSQVTRNGQLLLNAANMKGVVLHAGTNGDSVEVAGVLVPTTVNAGPGNDTVTMRPDAVLAPTRVNGQDGTDTLSYLFYSNNVYANLLTGEATDLLGGVSGVENLFGGTGHDVLVGDGASNVIRGVGGRDMIVGGAGRDLLDGGADDDLVLGGRTAYDANKPALLDIGGKWSAAPTYLAGIAQLKDPGYLYQLAFGVTVFSDGAQDRLIGGPGQDWFWADVFDLLLDIAPGEQVN